MHRTVCKSKLHGATITETELAYEGSITLDTDLMEATNIVAWERVQIVNINNGARIETFVIPGKAGSGQPNRPGRFFPQQHKSKKQEHRGELVGHELKRVRHGQAAQAEGGEVTSWADQHRLGYLRSIAY